MPIAPASGQTLGHGPRDQDRGVSAHHLQPDVVMEAGGVMLLDDELGPDRCGQRVDIRHVLEDVSSPDLVISMNDVMTTESSHSMGMI